MRLNQPIAPAPVVVYLPDGRPAPYVLTAEDAISLLRVDSLADPANWLYQRRREGMLRGTQVGKRICYLLPEVLAYLERQTDEKPR